MRNAQQVAGVEPPLVAPFPMGLETKKTVKGIVNHSSDGFADFLIDVFMEMALPSMAMFAPVSSRGFYWSRGLLRRGVVDRFRLRRQTLTRGRHLPAWFRGSPGSNRGQQDTRFFRRQAPLLLELSDSRNRVLSVHRDPSVQ